MPPHEMSERVASLETLVDKAETDAHDQWEVINKQREEQSALRAQLAVVQEQGRTIIEKLDECQRAAHENAIAVRDDEKQNAKAIAALRNEVMPRLSTLDTKLAEHVAASEANRRWTQYLVPGFISAGIASVSALIGYIFTHR